MEDNNNLHTITRLLYGALHSYEAEKLYTKLVKDLTMMLKQIILLLLL
jgi:hypothetical protein